MRVLAAALLLTLAAAPSITVAADKPAVGGKLGEARARRIETRLLTSAEGLEYRLIYSIPAGDPPPGGYPVIYVLDGNAHAAFTGEILRLSESSLGPVLVVGVGYPTEALYDAARRSYDLTPPGPVVKPDPDFAGMKIGGAAPFLTFLKERVKPAVAGDFKIDPAQQSLFGHSLGGLFVTWTVLNDPDAFNAYVAASPSLWWNGEALLDSSRDFGPKAAKHQGLRLLVTVGEYEGSVSPYAEWKLRRLAAADPAFLEGRTPDAMVAHYREGSAQTHMVANARTLAERLKGFGLNAVFVMYPGEEHTPAVVDAYNRGVRFVLGPGV